MTTSKSPNNKNLALVNNVEYDTNLKGQGFPCISISKQSFHKKKPFHNIDAQITFNYDPLTYFNNFYPILYS
jgi:hypothetical protein